MLRVHTTPYFAAMSALKMGADLAHVFCAEGAGQVIKSYSPELIVHPYLREGVKDVTVTVDGEEVHAVTYDEDAVFEAMEKVTPWLHRMDAIVVGPGLGRDPTMSEIAKRIIAFAHERDVPLVIDADGLRVLMEDQGLIGGPGRAVLTPNKASSVVSALRWRAAGGSTAGDDDGAGAICCRSTRRPGRRGERRWTSSRWTSSASRPGHPRLGVESLHFDVISSATSRDRLGDAGAKATCSPGASPPSRVGGQEQEAECAIARRIDVEGDHVDGDLIACGRRTGVRTHPSLGPSAVSVAAYAGCLVTRVAARAAFERKRRSMLATDVIEELGETMQRLFPICETRTDF